MNKFISRGTMALTWGVCLCAYLFYQGFKKESINGRQDMFDIRSTYTGHSFLENTGYRRMGKQYYIWIEDYSNRFQIPANYLADFNKDIFELKVKEGDKIKLSISNKEKSKLNSTASIFLTSVSVDGRTYLEKDAVMEVENSFYHKNVEFIVGLFWLVIGLGVFIRERVKKNQCQHSVKCIPSYRQL